MEPLKREDIKNLPLNLSNIIDVLERACLQIRVPDNGDLLMCIGNTASGKSTLLASLIYGSENMELKYLES